MSIVRVVNSMKKLRVIAVDPASHSLAWSVVDIEWKAMNVVATGKIDFKDTKEVSGKFAAIKGGINEVCLKYKPDAAVIEQSVYIQNFQSSRIISYIIGYTWGNLDDYCQSVCDVNPLIWKNVIGYKNISKEDKKRITTECGGKGVQKRLSKERKDRVKAIIEKQIAFSTDDEDINDSLGIALWYYIDRGYGTLQG
jgi:Holliday junction resolvasome RuvABC endonuclease subunit